MLPHPRILISTVILSAVFMFPLFTHTILHAHDSAPFLLTLHAAHAENACGQTDPFCLKKAATGGGMTPSGEAPSIPTAVGRILSAMLALLGVLFFALAFWAGFKWMTAHGNEETVTSAKTTLENAAIGLILVVIAYAVTTYVVNTLFWKPSVTMGGSLPPPSVTGPITTDCEIIYNGICRPSTPGCNNNEKDQGASGCETGEVCCVPQKTAQECCIETQAAMPGFPRNNYTFHCNSTPPTANCGICNITIQAPPPDTCGSQDAQTIFNACNSTGCDP
ncbi:MAG: pilin [Patescibacteria group bacterium]